MWGTFPLTRAKNILVDPPRLAKFIVVEPHPRLTEIIAADFYPTTVLEAQHEKILSKFEESKVSLMIQSAIAVKIQGTGEGTIHTNRVYGAVGGCRRTRWTGSSRGA